MVSSLQAGDDKPQSLFIYKSRSAALSHVESEEPALTLSSLLPPPPTSRAIVALAAIRSGPFFRLEPVIDFISL